LQDAQCLFKIIRLGLSYEETIWTTVGNPYKKTIIKISKYITDSNKYRLMMNRGDVMVNMLDCNNYNSLPFHC